MQCARQTVAVGLAPVCSWLTDNACAVCLAAQSKCASICFEQQVLPYVNIIL